MDVLVHDGMIGLAPVLDASEEKADAESPLALERVEADRLLRARRSAAGAARWKARRRSVIDGAAARGVLVAIDSGSRSRPK